MTWKNSLSALCANRNQGFRGAESKALKLPRSGHNAWMEGSESPFLRGHRIPMGWGFALATKMAQKTGAVKGSWNTADNHLFDCRGYAAKAPCTAQAGFLRHTRSQWANPPLVYGDCARVARNSPLLILLLLLLLLLGFWSWFFKNQPLCR